MCPSLAREPFLDRAWGPADLDAAAEFWLSLYEAAAKAQRFGENPVHRTELRLRGFPRDDADRLATLFAARAAEADFGEPVVSRPDPDTLSLASRARDGGDAPPVGLGLPALAGAEFDGLVVEVRFTVRDRKGKAASTLVLVGESRGGAFVLKAVWRAGVSRWDEELVRYARWADEEKFLAALDEFRRSGAAPARLAKKLFPPRGADRFVALMQWAVLTPLGKPRLAGLAARAIVLAGLSAGGGALGYWLWETRQVLPLAPVVMVATIATILFLFFLLAEQRVWSIGFAQHRALYAEFDQESPKLVPLTSTESARVAADPYARKYEADLLAAGFTFLGEARLEPAAVGEVVFRVFAAPDGLTYLTVGHQWTNRLQSGNEFRFWPAFVSFGCHTFLSGGGYVASLNGPRHGYRRKRTGPECLVRVFPEENDPVVLARLHAEVAGKLIAETGHPPLRHARFEDYVRLQNALSDEERRLHADRPYTLGDHVRWYLQLPRREYRG
jgi:hypothetical protein